MDHRNRLAYCELCNNRIGGRLHLKCSLTSEKPVFEEYCPDFNYDQQRENELVNQFYQNLPKIHGKTWPIKELHQNNPYTKTQTKYGKSKTHGAYFLGFGMLLGGLLIFRSDIREELIAVIFIGFLAMFMIAYGLNLLLSKEIVFKLSDDGIFINGTGTIPWNRVLAGAIQRGSHPNSTDHIFLLTLPQNINKIEITHLESTPRQMGKSIEEYRLKYRKER